MDIATKPVTNKSDTQIEEEEKKEPQIMRVLIKKPEDIEADKLKYKDAKVELVASSAGSNNKIDSRLPPSEQ